MKLIYLSLVIIATACAKLIAKNGSNCKMLKTKQTRIVKNQSSNLGLQPAIIKCKCSSEGHVTPSSTCTNGQCSISNEVGLCRKQLFCNRTVDIYKRNPIGNPALECLDTDNQVNSYPVYDCVHLQGQPSFEHCTTRDWNRVSVGCCSRKDSCNRVIATRISGYGSNVFFRDDRDANNLKPYSVPDGFPCFKVEQCRGPPPYVWCQKKWDPTRSADREFRGLAKVCCTQQLGLITATKTSDPYSCCGSNVECDWRVDGSCKCTRKVDSSNIEKPDGSACESNLECISKICSRTEKRCCTGETVGSYCSETDGIFCCLPRSYCNSDNKCASGGTGGLCSGDAECLVGQCKTVLVRNKNWERNREINSTSKVLHETESTKMCCKGQLGDPCPTACSSISWKWAGRCNTCCEGFTCFKGRCSNILELGSFCEVNDNCEDGICTGVCAAHNVTFDDNILIDWRL